MAMLKEESTVGQVVKILLMFFSAYMHPYHWTIYTYYSSMVCIVGIFREWNPTFVY